MERNPPAAILAIWLASTAVIAACAFSAFRVGFAEDAALLLSVNGPRLALAGAAGAALALAGALRQVVGGERPLRELGMLGISSGAAGGGFLLAAGRSGTAGLASFVAGAVLGATLFWALTRVLERPQRWTNLGVAAALAAMGTVAALAGTYARARTDAVAPAVAWLLGDLSHGSFAAGALVLFATLALLVLASRALSHDHTDPRRVTALSLLALGLGIGAAGPLAFVGSLVPRAVRGLAPTASARAFATTSVAAGAATVAAIDHVPRLLVGGYALPFNVAATMLAVPIFLAWNRQRLRREAGPLHPLLEAGEILLIAGLTLAAVALAALLTTVVRAAT